MLHGNIPVSRDSGKERRLVDFNNKRILICHNVNTSLKRKARKRRDI